MTTIKVLSDGREVALNEFGELVIGGRTIGYEPVRRLSAPRGQLTHWVRSHGAAVGLTDAEAKQIQDAYATARQATAERVAREKAAIAERERQAQAYDDIFNEGGEGYNPVRHSYTREEN